MNELTKGVTRYDDKKIDYASYDKSVTARVLGVEVDGYTILLNDVEYTNVPTLGGTCTVNEIVHVTIPQNNYSNMYILKTPTVSGESLVSSVNGRNGDVVLTKADVGLTNVDNTSDATKNVLSATKLTTARTIGLNGDVSGSVSFDGSTNVTITTTVADDSHNHIISNVDGLQTILDGKADKGTYDNDITLSGATVYSKVAVTDGVVTGLTTRNLTTDNIPATVNNRYVPIIPTVDSETKFLNGDGVFTAIAIGGATASGNLYLSNIASNIATYKKLTYEPDETETTISVTMTSTADVLSYVYLYDSPIGTTTIDSGIWKSTFYMKSNSLAGVVRLKIVGFVRHANGTETDLFTKYTLSVNSTTYQNYYTETSRGAFTVVETDRLGFRVYGSTDRIASTTIDYIIGDGNGSYINSPLALRHSQLRDKNGEAEYQHMSSADMTKFDSIEYGAEVNNISDINATDLTDGGDTTLHYHATDRNRANHTGTQLASTISDFASNVRSTILTGLSTATNSAILATDNILVALGKIQAQINNLFAVKYTAQTLTDAQKLQARTNIGAGTSSVTKTSELINDNYTVTDADYVHTDNNFTDMYMTKLDNVGEASVYQYSGTVTTNQVVSLTVPAIVDNKASNLSVLVLRNTYYEQAFYGIDYVYKILDSTHIQITFYIAGTYIANYGFFGIGTWTPLAWEGE